MSFNLCGLAAVQREHEHEIEIGYPTDVRHVSHVGLGARDSCPSWVRTKDQHPPRGSGLYRFLF